MEQRLPSALSHLPSNHTSASLLPWAIGPKRTLMVALSKKLRNSYMRSFKRQCLRGGLICVAIGRQDCSFERPSWGYGNCQRFRLYSISCGFISTSKWETDQIWGSRLGHYGSSCLSFTAIVSLSGSNTDGGYEFSKIQPPRLPEVMTCIAGPLFRPAVPISLGICTYHTVLRWGVYAGFSSF